MKDEIGKRKVDVPSFIQTVAHSGAALSFVEGGEGKGEGIPGGFLLEIEHA